MSAFFRRTISHASNSKIRQNNFIRVQDLSCGLFLFYDSASRTFLKVREVNKDMGAIDSKFLVAAASELLNEMRTRGWFQQVKSSLSSSTDCSSPTNDLVSVRTFVRCTVKNAMEPIETRFLILNLIVLLFLMKVAYSFGMKLKLLLKSTIQVGQQSSNNNESTCVNMTMLAREDQLPPGRPQPRAWSHRRPTSGGEFEGRV